MKKTLAQLKRDANSGKLKAVMTYRFGAQEIPERLRGVRPIVRANSVGIFFRNADGRESELEIKTAALCEYTDEKLTIYQPGERPLNEQEQRVMNEWAKIENTEEYQKRHEVDILTDGSSTYWQKKAFFSERNMNYLLGFDFERGMKLNFNTGNVIDRSIKGEKWLEYTFV